MDNNPSRRQQRSSRLRERQEARKSRQSPMAVRRGEDATSPPPADGVSGIMAALGQHAQLRLRDALWYVRHKPSIRRITAGVAVVAVLLFIASYALPGRIFPNVWIMGVPVGGMSVEEATAAVEDAWRGDIRISLFVEGETLMDVNPTDLGLIIDARDAAEQARAVGMGGIPMGWSIQPEITLDYIRGENFLLELVDDINTRPYNAGYMLENGVVRGITGYEGRFLDITPTMEQLEDDPRGIVNGRRLNLLTQPVPPDVLDPSPYLPQAQRFVSRPFELIGYDPFANESTIWAVPPDILVTWLEAGANGLTIREDVFRQTIIDLNDIIATDDPDQFLDDEEARAQVQLALDEGLNNVFINIRFRPQTYEVIAGDTGFRIARKNGVPYFLLEEVNAGKDMDTLSPGDIINLPRRDVTIQAAPVAHKRIVVDLNRQYMVAFENDEIVFQWPISSGVTDAPTSPGIFQVLSHAEVAYGSSFTLCGDSGCGQWTMYWFMGIYEVQPGLMNGFHGAVELPNGAYLGGGSVGQPYTFGCVMAVNDNAQALYDWADVGTIVEIISNEYEPRSDLGRRVWDQDFQQVSHGTGAVVASNAPFVEQHKLAAWDWH